MSSRHAADGAAAADDDYGLPAGQAARQAGELAGVTQGLQVLQDDFGGRVFFPVLQQVVAGDVRAVARGHEGGQAQAPLGDPFQDGPAQGTGLGEEADPAPWGQVGGERSVEGDLRVGIGYPQAVGAHDTHTGGAGGPDQFVLPFLAFGPGLAEPGADHDKSVDAFAGALVDHVRDHVGADRDNGEVDRVGDVEDTGYALTPQPLWLRGARGRPVPGSPR